MVCEPSLQVPKHFKVDLTLLYDMVLTLCTNSSHDDFKSIIDEFVNCT